MMTEIGLSGGRPLMAMIFWRAASFRASAPSPYSLRVGKMTIPPALMMAHASAIIIGSGYRG
ncbi:MAG: hypothetical protein A2V65_00090 [Deltaproteobacteria bacterium RBG_13_49_15]|nr:MAG: hypothetical protein A2V65_00090 [Deltaproteobacteria bacterium RBG_13_49_15]